MMSARCVAAFWPLTKLTLVEDNEADFCHSLSLCEWRSAKGQRPISLKHGRETGSGFAEMCVMVLHGGQWAQEDATWKMKLGQL